MKNSFAISLAVSGLLAVAVGSAHAGSCFVKFKNGSCSGSDDDKETKSMSRTEVSLDDRINAGLALADELSDSNDPEIERKILLLTDAIALNSGIAVDAAVSALAQVARSKRHGIETAAVVCSCEGGDPVCR